jgi:hypothetical protein
MSRMVCQVKRQGRLEELTVVYGVRISDLGRSRLRGSCRCRSALAGRGRRHRAAGLAFLGRHPLPRPGATLAGVERVVFDRWPCGGGDAHLTLVSCLRDQGFGRQSRDDSSSGFDGLRNRDGYTAADFFCTPWAAGDLFVHRPCSSHKIPVFKKQLACRPGSHRTASCRLT